VPFPLVAMENHVPAETVDGARSAVDCPRAGIASRIKERRIVRNTLGMFSGRRSDVVVHHHVVALHARCDLIRNIHSEGHRSLR